jgi:glutathione S-transferase
MKLYDLELSGNCYKVRLFAALANIDLDIEAVDFLAGDHKREPVASLNPFAELPVLTDENLVLRDSQAILVYLAAKYGGETWWPASPEVQGDIMQWLSIAANEIYNGPNTTRLIDKFGYNLDKSTAMDISTRILSLLDQHLANHDWLSINTPTIADCAVFPYVALSHEGGINIRDYEHIYHWMERIKALPNFIGMPGIH